MAGKSVEDQSARTATSKTFVNPDGTRSTQIAPEAIQYWDGTGWQPIDNHIVTDPSQPGALRNKANGLVAHFSKSGVGLETPDGTVSMSPEGSGLGTAPVVDADGQSVTFANVWPGVDVRYQILGDHLKEDVILRRKPDTTAFPFMISGKTVTARADGGLDLSGALAGKWQIDPPVVLDRNGNPVPAAAPQLTIGRSGHEVTLQIDPTWLTGLSAANFPVTIDPSVSTFYGTQSIAYPQSGTACGPCEVRVSGTPVWRTVVYFNYTTAAPWGVSGAYISDAKIDLWNRDDGGANNTEWINVYQATQWGWDSQGSTLLASQPGIGSYTFDAEPLRAMYADKIANNVAGIPVVFIGADSLYKEFQSFSLTLTWDQPPSSPAYLTSQTQPTGPSPLDGSTVYDNQGPITFSASSTDPDSPTLDYTFDVSTDPNFSTIAATCGSGVASTCTVYTDPNSAQQPHLSALTTNASYYWRVRVNDSIAAEVIGPRWSFKLDGAPPAATLDLPLSGAIVGTQSPTLTVHLGSGDPIDTEAYDIRVSSNDGTTVWDSNPTFTAMTPGTDFAATMPTGLLKDGVTYSWKVITHDGDGIHGDQTWPIPPALPWTFTTDFRLGDQASNPTDAVGPVTVNLANGNAVVKVASANLQTAGGPLGVSFTYNSRTPTSMGGSVLPAGWTMSVDADASLLYDHVVTVGKSVVLVEPSGATHQYVQDPSGAAAYAPVDPSDSDVVTKNGDGTFTVFGADGLTYRFDSANNLAAATTATDQPGTATGMPYDQRTDPQYSYASGHLTKISDRLSSRTLQFFYQGDTVPVGGAAACELASPPAPAGATAPPSGTLCRIQYHEGTDDTVATPTVDESLLFETKLYYVGGDLAQVINPGSEQTNFVYQTGPAGYVHQLTDITSPLANDALAASQRTDVSGSTKTHIAYYGVETPAKNRAGWVSDITQPLPTDRVGDQRPHRSFDYTVGDPNFWATTTNTHIDGIDDHVLGYARRDVMGSVVPNKAGGTPVFSSGQRTAEYDANGKASTWQWTGDDRLLWSEDANHQRTSTVYDGDNRPTDTYGPAAATCFTSPTDGSSAIPNGTCTNPSVPKTSKAYDGAANYSDGSSTNTDAAAVLQGLDAAYWAESPGAAGAPTTNAFIGDAAAHEFLAPTTTSSGVRVFDQVWSAAPRGLSTTTRWVARLTGEIYVPSGSIGLRVVADDGARVYIDNALAIDAWTGSTMTQVTVPAGRHQLRVDYYQGDTAGGEFKLTCDGCLTAPGGTQLTSGTPLPLWYLNPRYGYVTSTKDADGKQTNTEYIDPDTGVANPDRGLPELTIVDPSGLRLTTTTKYEPVPSPTFPQEYGRVRETDMPGGSASTSTYAVSAPSSNGSPDPCGSPTAVITQNGQLSELDSPTGAGFREQSFLYDRVGRLMATSDSTTGSAIWSCVHYDDRGRVTWTQDHGAPDALPTPIAAKTTTTTYVGLTTTTTYPDPTPIEDTAPCSTAGATDTGLCKTISKVDLLGRPYQYTDENGTVTTSIYDQAGRLIETDRHYGPLDASGNPTGATIAPLTAYGYDLAGHQTSITSYDTGAPLTTTFAYDDGGRLVTTSRPNQVVTTTAYETSRGFVNTITDQRATTKDREFTYTHSGAGRETSENESVTSRLLSYLNPDGTPGYDGAGRLIRAVDGATVRFYDYDKNSNRCATTDPGTNGAGARNPATCAYATQTYFYDSGDRINTSPFSVSNGYGYDRFGNVTSVTGSAGNPNLAYQYDGNDHATSINDGTNITTEMLSPSGRVLRHQVAPVGSPTAYSEDLTYGYADGSDSVAYQINNLTSGTAPTGAQPRSSTSAHNNAGVDTTLVTTTPAGALAGDVMIAGIVTRGVATVTTPSGWTQIGTGYANGSSMTLRSYYRIASGSEPATTTWTLSDTKAATGTIVAYSGVDTTSPVDVAAGSSNLSNSMSIVAPTATTTAANERVVGLFATMATTSPHTTVIPPAGLTERGDDSSDANSQPPATLEVADFVQVSIAATGNQTATASASDRTTGQLIALRNAPPPTGTITARSWTAGHNDAVTPSVVINKPTGTTTGDVLIAGIATRNTPSITPPSGWQPIRTEGNLLREAGSSWTLQSYYKIAGSSEPANYSFSLSVAKAAAGTITAYTGVDTTTPIDVTSGHVDSTATTTITATGVTTTAANDMVVGIYENIGAATFTPPTGMTERGEDQSNVSGQSHVDIETADMTQTVAGATGNQVATASASNSGAAELITLKAGAATGGGTVSSITTYTSGPGGLLVVDTSGTPTYPLANTHGDIVAITDATGTLTANPTVDEFGKQIGSGQPANHLGWLGGKERLTVAGNGTIRMGVRLYDPNLGRFLSTDPVAGGSANDYDYAGSDPVNAFDLDGNICFSCAVRHVRNAVRKTATVVEYSAAAAGIAASIAVAALGPGEAFFTLGAIGYGLYGGAALLRGATGQGGKGMEDILWGEAGYIGTNGRVAREFFGKGRSLRIFNGVKAFIQLQWLFPQRAE